MGIFDEFDAQVDTKEMKKNVEVAKKNTGDFPEIPKGKYVGEFKKLEVGTTKGKDARPMLKVQFKITSGKYKNSNVFMNRVLFGTKNDANMIASAVGFLDKLETELIPEFDGYNDFADLVMDIMEEIEGYEFDIMYDKDAFNSISIA